MRSWLFRRRVADTSGGSSSYAIAELAPRLGGVLDVEQVKTEGHALGFGGRLLLSPPSALTELVARFRPLGYTPFLQEGAEGMTWVRALPFVDVQVPSKPRLNILLFVLTVASTIMAGSGAFFAFDPLTEPRRILDGVPFAFTLLAILGTHEFGHYFVARAYGASVSLPYFIPAPPPFLFGTLGAIIRMRSPARDRNSLFDIAAAGPIAGLLVALPALWIGLGWSKVAELPSGGSVVFGDSLIMRFMTWLLFGQRHRQVSIATFLGLLALGAITGSANWFVWGFLLFFVMGFQHQPPLDDLSPLSPGRYAVGVLCLVLLILLIPPVPVALQ